MRYIVLLLAMLAMACSGCRPAASKPDIQVMLIHADIDFEPWERSAIQEAAAQWEKASRGHIQLLVQFDTDYTSEEEVDRLDGGAVLLKGNSRMAAVRAIDEEGDGILLGLTLPRGHGSIVILVADRLSDTRDMVGVATHELGHALGMPDLDDPGHVMSGHHSRGVHLLDQTDIATCRQYSACP